MKATDHKPNVISYTALMSAYAAAMLWRKAEKVAIEMTNEEIKHTLVSYTTLIGAYANAGEWEKALYCLESMPGEGLRPDAFTYNRVLRAMQAAGEQEKALDLFARMTEASVAPDANTFDALADDQVYLDYYGDTEEEYGNEGGGESSGAAPNEEDKGGGDDMFYTGERDADFSLIDALDVAADGSLDEGAYSIVVAAAGGGKDLEDFTPESGGDMNANNNGEEDLGDDVPKALRRAVQKGGAWDGGRFRL